MADINGIDRENLKCPVFRRSCYASLLTTKTKNRVTRI